MLYPLKEREQHFFRLHDSCHGGKMKKIDILLRSDIRIVKIRKKHTEVSDESGVL